MWTRQKKIKKYKPFFYVCCNYTEKVSDKIEAASEIEAAFKFRELRKAAPDAIHGPFFNKRVPKRELKKETKTIKYKVPIVSKKGIYAGWHVNATLLLEPENSAYIFFEKPIFGTDNINKPANIIININELQEMT